MPYYDFSSGFNALGSGLDTLGQSLVPRTSLTQQAPAFQPTQPQSGVPGPNTTGGVEGGSAYGGGDAPIGQQNAGTLPPMQPDAAKTYLATYSAHPDRPGDTSNFNPAFAGPLAAAIQQARAEGLKVGVGSGFREPGQTGSAYDAAGYSSHSYGLASDISGLDGPNGPITQRWAQIAQSYGLNNPYGIGNAKEYNHWQLPAQPLERMPDVLSGLKDARSSGTMQDVWSAYPSTLGGSLTP
jgi:hypothetical protein